MNKNDEEILMARIESLEAKVDRLLILVERASGAWVFAKWFSAALVGAATIWAGIKAVK